MLNSVTVCLLRLYLLLRQVWGGADCDRIEHEAVEFSSHLSSTQRGTALEQLRTGELGWRAGCGCQLKHEDACVLSLEFAKGLRYKLGNLCGNGCVNFDAKTLRG